MSIPSTVVMNMYLLSSFYVPGTIEDTGDAAENKINKKHFLSYFLHYSRGNRK